MTTYKGIRGVTLRTVEGDISPVAVGEIWYDSSAKVIKVGKLVPGAWASGGNMNSGRKHLGGTATSQTAALAFGGTPPETTYGNLSETYDGTSWTETSELVNKKSGRGSVGINTAALAVGNLDGTISPSVGTHNEEWDGSSWSEEADLNAARFDLACFGTVTAAIAAGGDAYPATPSNKVESWDGSSWTETTEVNTARGEGATGSSGTLSTAGLIFGAVQPISTAGNQVESWNGSAWTEVTELSTARCGCQGSGTQTAAMAMGGAQSETYVESWDGSSWTEIADLSTGRTNAGAGGTTSNSVLFGGTTIPGYARSALTEEWTGESVSALTVTSS